jgi:Trypsin-co-occurring domain 2
VLLRVKQEVGLYQNESASWHAALPELFRQRGIVPECGNGDINFVLKEIRMEFSAVLDRTDKASIGLKVPFGPVEASAGAGGSVATKRSQLLTYTYYVPAGIPPDPGFKNLIGTEAVILPTLSALRDSLILATTRRPCMANTPPDRDNTFTFGLELTRAANADVGFTFAVVNADAGTDRQRGSGNTITVTFHPTPTPRAASPAR